MVTTGKNADAFQIKEDRDGERQFIIQPGDNDLFVRTGRQVIEGCRLTISLEVWLKEFQSTLEFVRSWTLSRADRVRSCYCAPRVTRIIFFFVPKSDHFDFDLADQLTELNAELVTKFNIGMIEIHQIPWSDVDRFFDPVLATPVYGEQPESHRAVEA